MKSVVTNEYKELQESMIDRQQELKTWLKGKTNVHLSSPLIDRKKPIVKQISLAWVPAELYIECARSLSAVLKRKRPDLDNQLDRLLDQLDADTALSFIEESLTYSQRFFRQWASEHNVSPWLAEFIAEQSLRPFLYLLADGSKNLLDSFQLQGLCPCCAEPVRLAALDSDGEKTFLCPRCEADWKLAAPACIHCGEGRSEQLVSLDVETGDETEIEVCQTCSRYVKLIRVSEAPAENAVRYDLETLHLDYTAQDAGYGEKLEF
ncbi:formate dehydrogenase accessory protein FdhE [Salisediminibacterium halotolerans]|uniref:FdhE protein n=1 Tax=Salisediminibacterium halotolerans TaxID=517425 RepID=A0A1H9RE51_9BACI|nr:formate dehydrogenase accessory protein FdhE [Salisediminibacterium haloalkalitolerans]SER71161.1 FdhE protein [Salisediminibacterium haloalkalitolerans]